VAANAMTASATRLAELEEEGKASKEAVQEEWQQFVNAR
jgi:hypothetical protein